jgi:hypothetical protein
MSGQWVVLMPIGQDGMAAYGPMDGVTAGEFAQYLNAQARPALRVQLLSPTRELLSFWRATTRPDRPREPIKEE